MILRLSLSCTITLVLALTPGLPAKENSQPEAAPSPSSFAATLVEPFYPPLRPVPAFQRPALPAEKWSVPLQDEATFKIEDFVERESLDGEWKISGLENSPAPFDQEADFDKGIQKSDFNDASWDTIAVPLDWYVKYPQFRVDKVPPYVKGWYRKKIDIPSTRAGKRVLLTFDVAAYEAVLFVNGVPLGTHHGDFTPWTVDITEAVKFGAENVIALRLFSDFGPKFGVTYARHVYGSQWSISNIKGGLWQSARLSYENPVYIKRLLISPNLKNSSIDIEYVITNKATKTQKVVLQGTVLSAEKGTEVEALASTDLGSLELPPGETAGKANIVLSQPALWSPDQPNLYNLFLTLVSGKKPIGGRVERFGYRDFKVKGNAFYLNGKQIYLFGGNLPSVRFGGTAAGRDEEIAKAAEMLKGLRSQGFNIIRTAHAPVPPYILDLADELGLMIYAEWGWSFTDSLDQASFEKNNLAEITEWVERDYNHPSVAMWSCGNEVHYDKPGVMEQLNKAVAKVRELDQSGRPISVFSGAAFGYGKEKLDTDFLDLHTYMGASTPWTQWPGLIAGKIFTDFIYPTYGEKDRLEIPFVVWETIGFSWGEKSDPTFKVGDLDSYAKYAESTRTWAKPNGIGYSGMLGLATALDPAKGLLFGRNLYGKRIAELIRRDIEHFQGFAPWFPASSTPVPTLWNQPVFCGLRSGSGFPLRNVFEGSKYEQELFIVNSTGQNLDSLQARLTLVALDGQEMPLAEVPIDFVASFARTQTPVGLAIPQNLAAGFYQIRIMVSDDQTEVSRNFYDVFIGSQSILTSGIASTKKVGVLAGGDSRTESILSELGVPYVPIKETKKLADCQVLIVPAAAKPNALLRDPQALREIKNWVRAGGSLLVLEQEYSGTDPFGNAMIKKDNTFVDIVLTGHPIFKGLSRDNFDTWDNPDRGLVVRYPFPAFSMNAVAVRGSFPKEQSVPTVALEGTYGAGRIFESQLAATGLWGVDSSASLYLRNLLNYVVGNEKLFADARPWTEASRDFKVAKDAVVSVDLAPHANMGFADEIAEDKKGGWTDEGDNDFRTMPLGRQTMAGVPFDIIDPKNNNGKSCVVLRNGVKNYFPAKVDNIAVNENFRKLFFLHAMAWESAKVGEYRIRYADGSTEVIYLENGKNIGDWWSPGDLPEALLGVTRENLQSQGVGLWVMPWNNPRPEAKIAGIDFESYGKAVPILVAISGEKAGMPTVSIDDGETVSNWSATSQGNGEKPSVGRIDTNAEPQIPRGNSAVKVEMPPQTKESTPAVFTRFDKTLPNPSHRYLCFWIRALSEGSVSVVLPRQDWSSTIKATVPLAKAEGWKKVELNLRDDMGLKEMDWDVTALRGELFIYNRGGKNGETPAVSFLVSGIKLE